MYKNVLQPKRRHRVDTEIHSSLIRSKKTKRIISLTHLSPLLIPLTFTAIKKMIKMAWGGVGKQASQFASYIVTTTNEVG